MGVKGKLLKALISTYSSPTMEVKMADTTSEVFQMKSGLRQGSVLSPLLFIILFSDMVNKSWLHPGLQIDTDEGPEDLSSQCFVDDTVLLTTVPENIVDQI